MRILVVQESDWLRRNPVQQHHTLERLSLQGHEVVVIDYPIRWRDEGGGLIARRMVRKGVARVIQGANVTVIRSASLRVPGIGKLVWLFTNVIELVRCLRSFDPDVVVVLGLSNGIVALWLGRLAGTPVVVHLIDALHTLVEPRFLRPVAAAVERAILRHADRVVVINKALALYVERMGVPLERIEVIPAGADTARFGPHVDGSAVRGEFGLRTGDTVMLFVGWLYKFSGIRELAEAMAAEEADDASLRLLVVGDGDISEDLIRLRDERLGERLILAGAQPVSRIPQFMAAAEICVLPASVNATMAHIVPAKIHEYLSAGRPIVATSLPGLKCEFGEHSGIVYVNRADDVPGTARRLAGNAGQRARLGDQALSAALANGTWDVVTARFGDVLAASTYERRTGAA